MKLKFIAVAFAALYVTPYAQADITRSCQASLEFFIKDNNPQPYVALGGIEGRGSCNNKLQADKCRENARKALNSCLGSLWANRNVNQVPAACNSIIGGSSRSGAKLTYDGILPIQESNRLTARAAFEVCCVKRKNAGVLVGQFGGRISGDRKCASTKIGNDMYQDEYAFQNYTINCTNVRAQGLCGSL